MLRAGLMRKHHQFLGAHPLRVDVGDDFEPGLLQLAQPEIRHLNSPLLLGRNLIPASFNIATVLSTVFYIVVY